MLRSILTSWRPVALAAAVLALAAAPACVQAAGHAGGHAAGGYHAGGMHYGGYRAGGYRPGYISGYHNGYSDHQGYGYHGGYYTPWLYGSGAYISNNDGLPPDFYYSPTYTTGAPAYGMSADYTPEATAPVVTAPTVVPNSTASPATVAVHVPASAQVWFDDSPTTQTGDQRQYVSPSLVPGKDYTYDVRAQWTDNGKVVDETRHVTVHANGATSVDFTQAASAVSASK